jgi:hypothetical protein
MHAVVVSIDEKSQIQALDRTQPGLPIKPGKCGTMTHDYKRNGTTTLFAALDILDGTVIGRCMDKHRHQQFIRFLNAVERAVPVGKVIHAIVDKYATHNHPNVMKWLARHPRRTFHFTPTSASWLNAVEGFFSTITRRKIRRGVFKSVADCEDAPNHDPVRAWTDVVILSRKFSTRQGDAFRATTDARPRQNSSHNQRSTFNSRRGYGWTRFHRSRAGTGSRRS